MYKPAILVLADGTVFHGNAIGAHGHQVGEVVFNTAMSGYQEMLTDPSYAQQILTLTYPHIGNVGCNDLDTESKQVHAAGLVIRNLPLLASNWRSQMHLSDYLEQQGVVAISDIDTRQLTRLLRDKGAQHGCIMAGDVDVAKAQALAKGFPGLAGCDLAKQVSTTDSYSWSSGIWQTDNRYLDYQTDELAYHVVAYDFGIKHNILRLLVEHGCRITVVPAQTSAEDVLALQPNGVFLSNGPGDPQPCDYAIAAIETLLENNMPLFGICLGHQLLALACGATTKKMKFGHHGANHPVQDLHTRQVFISSQNHGFTVDEASLPAHLQATHRSLFDGSLQGIRHRHKPALGFQGHPEASPGPHDLRGLFQQFIQLMQEHHA